MQSPSSRRAWVEISQISAPRRNIQVALLTEGVGRNSFRLSLCPCARASPSSRRAWVEMFIASMINFCKLLSPSSRRAWVEIRSRCMTSSRAAVALLAEGVGRNPFGICGHRLAGRSPSSRRAWVEITETEQEHGRSQVALLAEVVGRNPDFPSMWHYLPRVALLAEGVGRNASVTRR